MRPVRWVGSALRDLKGFPRAVQRDIGQALYAAQCGETYPSIKALKGFQGASVLEIVAPFETDVGGLNKHGTMGRHTSPRSR